MFLFELIGHVEPFFLQFCNHRSLILSSIFLISIQYVSGSISTKIGFALFLTIASTVDMKVCETVITSSLFPISRALSARKRASEPEFTPIPCFIPTYFEKSSSNFLTSSPKINHPLFRTLWMALFISSLISKYCLFISRNFIVFYPPRVTFWIMISPRIWLF